MKKLLIALTLAITPLATWAQLVNGTPYGYVPGNPYISGTAIQGYEMIARMSCSDMNCVQQNLKLIDSQIADLLARRLAFAKRAAQLKNSAAVPDNYQQNPNLINEVTRQAQAQGVPPEIAQAVFQEIDRQSQAYEAKFHRLTPNAPPSGFAVPTPDVTNPVNTPVITPGTGVSQDVHAGTVVSP